MSEDMAGTEVGEGQSGISDLVCRTDRINVRMQEAIDRLTRLAEDVEAAHAVLCARVDELRAKVSA